MPIRRLLMRPEAVLGSPVRNLVSILVFMAVVVVVATAAYVHAGWSLGDASYMVVLTVYTVGYGEIRPIDTPYLHFVTMATMVLGCTGMILLTSALVQVMTQMQLRELLGARAMQNQISRLSGHVIVCGYGRIGSMLAHELSAAGAPLIVLDRSVTKLAEAEAAGFLVHAGDATDEEVLAAVRLDHARVLATVLPDDAANVFITLSARTLNPAVQIIARGEAASTESKLRRAGADHVVLPTQIGAERIARLILFPASARLADETRLDAAQRELSHIGLRLEAVPCVAGARMCDATVAEAEQRAQGSLFVAEIERDGEVIRRPASDERIRAGDTVLIVVRNAALAAKTMFNTKAEHRIGRGRY